MPWAEIAIGSHAKLTVKNCLGERHDSGGETDEQSLIALPALHLQTASKPTLYTLTNLNTASSCSPSSVVIDNHAVQTVQNSLNGIDETLTTTEAVFIVPTGLSVDVVNGGIDLVGFPNGPLELASGHGMRAKQDVQ